jgi:hypothetical protein
VILSTNIGKRNSWWLPGISFHKFLQEKNLVVARRFSIRIMFGKTPCGHQVIPTMIIGWDSCQKYWSKKCLMAAKCFSCQYFWDESLSGRKAILAKNIC